MQRALGHRALQLALDEDVDDRHRQDHDDHGGEEPAEVDVYPACDANDCIPCDST
jgi:hypothetical protein